jgi:diaminopimelate epimerase
MKGKIFVITAAGGNGTAIKILEKPLTRKEYAKRGNELLKKTEPFGAEQAGFLIPKINHFEMAGGEFCGNAARSAALLLSEIKKKPNVSFTMSGYKGTITGTVRKINEKKYEVECVFPGFTMKKKKVKLSNGQEAMLVDLGGIVHIVMKAKFPQERKIYQALHKKITKELNLENKSAVGVVWIEKTENSVKMHPVVWVKEVNTFFYETSCGSGAIAVGEVTGICSIIQPTGKEIIVNFKRDSIILKSEMEVVYIEN